MKKTPQQIAAEFNNYNLHDDTIKNLQIIPSESKKRYSKIVLDFAEAGTGKLRQLTLTGCSNISLAADFGVLTETSGFGNTEKVHAITDKDSMRKIMADQVDVLNIEYYDENDEPSDKHPTRKKLLDLTPFILFRISFFGGTLQVIARNFIIKQPRINKTC